MSARYTQWFDHSIKPCRRGVYATARKSSAYLGWGYMRWDGEEWHQFGAYADYRVARDMCWRGLSEEVTLPSDWEVKPY